MKKFNLFGGGFQHVKSTTLGKEAINIEWDYNSFENDETFYVDYAIKSGISDTKSKTKYGLFLESKYITPGLEDFCISNLNILKKEYKNIFTHNKKLLDLDGDLFKFCPANGTWISEPRIYNKTKLISMICSNKQMTELQRFRVSFANGNRNNLDLYGRGFNPLEEKEDGLRDYMFSVCIENGVYESYFTEKILDCFATGTIPIYLGTTDINNYFNSDGIILLTPDLDLRTLTKELYDSKISAILDNLEKVKDYYTVEDFIYKNYLEP